jgi:hypothetical protein
VKLTVISGAGRENARKAKLMSLKQTVITKTPSFT